MSWSTTLAMTPIVESSILYKSYSMHFTLALAVSEILSFKNADIENVGQGHAVQHAQWCYFMANINVNKSHNPHFCASSLRFRDINVSNVWPWRIRSWSPSTTTVAALPYDGENQTLWVITRIFTLDLTVSEISRFEIIYLENLDQGHEVRHLQWSHSMVNINRYKNHNWALSLRVVTVFQIFAFQILWPWKYRSPFVMVLLDGKYITSLLMAIVMFALLYLSPFTTH